MSREHTPNPKLELATGVDLLRSSWERELSNLDYSSSNSMTGLLTKLIGINKLHTETQEILAREIRESAHYKSDQ